jgi:hypothetical protein
MSNIFAIAIAMAFDVLTKEIHCVANNLGPVVHRHAHLNWHRHPFDLTISIVALQAISNTSCSVALLWVNLVYLLAKPGLRHPFGTNSNSINTGVHTHLPTPGMTIIVVFIVFSFGREREEGGTPGTLGSTALYSAR